MRRSLTLVVAVVLIAGLPGIAGAAHGLVCGSSVDQDVMLTHDLVGCTGDGLIATEPGITIDLGGHTISAAGGDAGIRIPAFQGVENVTILNGTITGFKDAVRADITSGNHISRLHLVGNTRGINFANVDDSVVEKNTISGSALDGIRIDGGSDGNVVQKNVLSSNVFGISVSNFSDDNVVTKNDVTGSSWGISVFTDSLGNEVSRNYVAGSIFQGIQIERRSHDAVVARNTVTANGQGILVTGIAGEVVLRATVERNDVFDNNGDGIRIAGDNGLITRNDVYENGGHGISLTENSANNVASFNDVFSNSLEDIIDNGDNMII